MVAVPTAPGGLVAPARTDFAVVVVPVVLLGCWEVVALAAGTAVGAVALLSCPDVGVDMVGVGSANVVPGVVGVVPLTMVGDVAAGDDDVPASGVLVAVL